jgi:glycosyltransferase involved in cell wall biosynthesis
MRIAHLTPVYPPYPAGSGIACAYQAGELARRGHDVTVWTVDRYGPPPTTPALVKRLPAALQIGAAPFLPSLFRLPEVDVVHVHHPFIFGVEPALWAKWRRRCHALVVSYHNLLVGQGVRAPLFVAYEKTMGRALARSADRICVLSEAHASTVPYLSSLPSDRSIVVPNGVDTERFTPGRNVRPANIPEDAFVVVHVSTLDRVHFLKRPDLALSAVAQINDSRVHLVIIGDGETRQELQESYAARRLGGRLHFLGHRDHEALPAALRMGDAFLLSSDLDAFPLVLLEALSCGLPAIATDPPGVRAIIGDSVAGVLVPVGSTDAMAAAIRDLAAAPRSELAIRARAARELVERHYSLGAVVDRLEAVYAAALA